ncbi:MAG: glycosyl transferase family 1 [Chitinophagaceae bacterium]|nr:glycosyl transferase family 1 [Chitinophagaceae bacterium]
MTYKGTVLIFAYECYPNNRIASAIGAQRPYQFAKNLSALGWKVIVLCCDKDKRKVLKKSALSRETARILQQYKAQLAEDNYTIIPLPSLHHHGFSDWVWTQSVTVGPGDTYIPKGFPFTLFRKAATFYSQLIHGDYSWSWVPVAERFAELLIKEQHIHIILGEHSPDAGIILSDRFSKRHNIPWIADFRDPALRFFSGYLAKLYKKVIQRIVRSASCTLTVSEYWSSLDKVLFQKESHVILNGYDQELFHRIEAHLFPSFTVSYFGSFDQRFQDILPSLEAFSLFLKQNNYPPTIQLFYRGLAHEEFLLHCNEIKIPLSHLNIQGFCERDETVAYMKGSQVLLIYAVALDKTTNRYEQEGVYPGKIFEYLGARQPILLVPSDQGILKELIHKQDRGMAASSIEEAVTFLQEKYEHWNKGTKEPLATDDPTYSREFQARQLDQILLHTLGLKG